MIHGILSELAASDELCVVSLYRGDLDDEAEYGVVLHADEHTTAIASFYREGWTFDGVRIFVTDDIVCVDTGSDELLAYARCARQTKQSLAQRYADIHFPDLRILLTTYANQRRPALVHCERLLSDVLNACVDFEARDDWFKAKHIDVEGRDGGAILLPVDEITRVDLGSAYCDRLATFRQAWIAGGGQ